MKLELAVKAFADGRQLDIATILPTFLSGVFALPDICKCPTALAIGTVRGF